MMCFGLMIAVLGFVMIGCTRDDEQGLTEPTLPNDDLVQAIVGGGSVTIVAIGDSITAGVCSSVGGYPKMLQDKLRARYPRVTVRNAGDPGERSPYTDERFQREIGGAKIVLLLIGTNDIGSPGGCPHEGCQTIYHIGAMIDKAKKTKVIPIISTIIPAKSDDINADMNPEIIRRNKQIMDLCQSKRVRCVDNHRAILEHGGDGLFCDRLHPNDRGYKVMAEEWQNTVEKVLGMQYREGEWGESF